MIFNEFQKIPRLNRHMVITEKIDGTNAQVYIEETRDAIGAEERYPDGSLCIYHEPTKVWYAFYAGSRSRWITPENDNYGFANWAYTHAEELVNGLGAGAHFGEWWGAGIQRRYGQTEKRFSLFNTSRWLKDGASIAPGCCSVVPVLYTGPFDVGVVNAEVAKLAEAGSVAAPGFKPPEGVVVFLAAAKQLFKVTCEKDESHKGAQE